jgi:hypothetical protein
LAIFASATFWVLLCFGRDALNSRWRLGLMLAWFVMLIGAAFIPGGGYFFMAVVSIIDIGLILAIFGGDIEIR